MKKIIALALCVVLIFALAACTKAPVAKEASEEAPAAEKTETVQSGENQEETASISGSITFAQHRTDLEVEMEALIAAFNEVYPDVKVNLENVSDYVNVMSVRIAGGEVPDVCEILPTVVTADKWADYFMPLNNSKLYGKLVGEEFFSVDGNVYAFASAAGYICFMYNRTLWSQAGIETVPTSWDELIADLEKLSALDGVIPFTSQYKTEWAQAYWLNKYMPAIAGNDWLNNWTKTTTPFTDDKMIQLLGYYRTMIEKGLVDPDLMSSDWDLQASDFVAGKIATYYNGAFANATMLGLGMDPNEIGFFAMPKVGEEGTVTFGYPDYGFAVSKDTENYEAAMAFAEFIAKNYAKFTNQITPVLGEQCPIEGINEMLATNPTIVNRIRETDEYNAINAIAGISVGKFVQEYIIADDPNTVIEKYNTMWADAMEEYNK